MARTVAAMGASSSGTSVSGISRKEMTRSARFTARSPMRSRSLVIFKAATMRRISSSEKEPRCSVLGIGERNGEMELRAQSDFALDPDASAVDLYKVLGDGQPEAGTADLTRTRGVHAIKTFKNARLIGLRDADAAIGDGEDDFAVVGLRADRDLAARERVLGRVIQQILQNLGQKAAVACDFRQILGDIDGNADVFFRGAMLRSLQAAFDELRNAEGVDFELQAIGVHLRKFEQ